MHQVPTMQPQNFTEMKGTAPAAAMIGGRGHRDRAGGACDDYRLLFAGRFTPSVGGRAEPVLPTRPCSAGDEWDTRVGSAAVAGTTAIGPPRPGTENAFFVRHFGRITYLRAALPSPAAPPRRPLQCTHTHE